MKNKLRTAIQLLLFPLLLIGFVYAATPLSYAQLATNEYNTESNVPNNNRTKVQATIYDILGTTYCILTGIDPVNKQPCLGINPYTQQLGYAPEKTQGGLIGFMGGQIGGMYAPPGMTADTIRSVATNFGIVKNVHAQEDQGYGANNLSPLSDIFSVTRNLAYMLLVIVFVLIGMAIMLRIKIDPRTVMTVQNRIPKIIVGILLITFSYAIAGFLIDLMWVTTYVSVNTLTEIQATSPSGDVVADEITAEKATRNLLDSPIGFISGTLGIIDTVRDTGGSLGDILTNVLLSAIGIEGWKGDCGLLGGTIKACVYDFFHAIFVGIGWLIVLIALIVTLFRIWFMLLKAYAYLVLDVILAPLWIIAGLIPGSSLGFGSWIRHFLSHLLIFPAAVSLFLLAGKLIEIMKAQEQDGGAVFLPPLIGTTEAGRSIGVLIGLGIIFLMPELLNIIRDALKSPASKAGGTFAAGIGVGAGVGIGAIKGTGGTIKSSKEWVVKDNSGKYRQAGFGKAIAGRVFR
jgi:hypothetical protein